MKYMFFMMSLHESEVNLCLVAHHGLVPHGVEHKVYVSLFHGVYALKTGSRQSRLPVFYLLFLSMAEIASEHRMPAAARPMIRKNVAL